MTVDRVIELIFGQAGVIFVLLLVLWSGFKGYWVWGTYAQELRNRIDRLEARLDRAERVAESGTGLAHRAASLAERREQVSGE